MLVPIGIDVGGTKTHMRVSPRSSQARDLILPSADWRPAGSSHSVKGLADLLIHFLDGDLPSAIVIGAHGCDDDLECSQFRAQFEAFFDCPIMVVNDAELFGPAMGFHNCIGVVAGTGSIAVSRDGLGRMQVAGGWGWIIGDEGSAPGLVREAAKAARLHIDRGGSCAEPLVAILCSAFQLDRPTHLGTALAEEGSAADLGRHAPRVFEAAEAGSTLARRVIDEGAAALAQLVRHLNLSGVGVENVVAGGAVILGQRLLATAFLREMRARFDQNISVRFLDRAPVEGACHIAEKLSFTCTGK
ncbi:BadF/BadG/BcrA/BcrD ATPase family protein [Mesorhizobium ciceri]|uniref:N-acetylglucosamine kinase n=1 Tax=Mesorhizobium TaxID=68287 RepID=UPI00047909E4